MRKAVILFILIISIALMIAPVSAAPQVTMSSSNANPYRGTEITLTIKVSDGGSHRSGGIVVNNYDTSNLELIGGEWLLSGTDIKDFSVSAKDGVFTFEETTAISGDVFALKFRVKGTAEFNPSTVSATLTLSGTSYPVSCKVTVACKHNYSNWASADGSKHSHKCSICGNVETKNHSFTNACDTSCNDGCGYTRNITHKYSTTYSTNAESHYYACTVCGSKKDVQIHIPGEAATEEHAQNCTVCGYEIAPKLDHVHKIQGEQLKDETGHWFDCSTCEEKAEFAEHSYEFECSTTCSVCGFKRETQHTLAPEEELKWESDEDAHWHECTVCGEAVDTAEHISDNHPVTPSCSVCGHSLQHVHAYSDKWTCDGENHWHECACGDKKDVTAHTLGEGVMTVEPEKDAYGEMVFTCSICGGEKKAMVVSAVPELLPWWIACGVLAVLFVGALSFVIVVIVNITKKPVGKFAGSKK